tara:strand:- start:315 stop:1001 length:687 start_codon:yes stop_codon:yes gene_type:complete
MKFIAITPDIKFSWESSSGGHPAFEYLSRVYMHETSPDFIICRNKNLNKNELDNLVTEIQDTLRRMGNFSVKLILNTNGNTIDYINEGPYEGFCPYGGGIHGFHLTSTDLFNIKKEDLALLKKSHYLYVDHNRDKGNSDVKCIFGASCHNEEELKRASELGVDYCLLSPIKSKYEGIPPLGWKKFKSLSEKTNIPIFPLGGLNFTDVKTAEKNNAAGIAGISLFNQSS